MLAPPLFYNNFLLKFELSVSLSPSLPLSPHPPPPPPPPSPPNGIIPYRLKDSATPDVAAIVNGTTTSHVLKFLKEGQTYSIRVAASNSVGRGPFSPESLAIPGKSALMEPQGPFPQTIGFIVMVTIIIIVLLLVGFVLLILVLRYKKKHRRSAGKYHGE